MKSEDNCLMIESNISSYQLIYYCIYNSQNTDTFNIDKLKLIHQLK